jgi:thiol-disulfide isomerase/thioredoxin
MMFQWILTGLVTISFICCATVSTMYMQTNAAETKTRWFRASLTSPGGDLVFGLKLETKGDQTTATVVNGSEHIVVPTAKIDPESRQLELSFDHYDSKIEARWSDDLGQRMIGRWRKRAAGKSTWVEMVFQAEEIKSETDLYISARESADLTGRWLVQFAADQDPAVGVFQQKGNSIEGTFLTTTGDFRFLAGRMRGQEMEISCFDGAHAFLFRAKLKDDQLTGDFWSGASFHDTWTAVKNEKAKLPNPFGMTKWNENVKLADLKFSDLDGNLHSLAEVQFAGKAIVLQLFGSWCPNCHDAADFLAELHREYEPQGLSIVGLAFEYTEDLERNAEQVRRYMAKHGTKYPVLIVGPSDKARATEVFRGIDRVKAYPTTIFMNGRGEVHSIYVGFSGPATGDAHTELKQSYRRIIEELIRSDVKN